MEIPTGRLPQRWFVGEVRAAWAAAGGDALLALFVVILGWKMTYGLGHVLDIELGDESYYLRAGLDFFRHRPAADWSPLYDFVYWLLAHRFHDPVAVYMANQELQTVLLPAALFLCLRAVGVGRLPALLLSAYFLISAADLPIWPKPMHFAMTVLLLFLVAFFRLRASPARIPLLLLGAGIASMIRPEFLIAFGLLACVLAYELVRRGSKALRALYAILCLVPVAILFLHFGVPFSNQRSFAAFTDHFVMNYAHAHRIVGDAEPLAPSIMRATFGSAHDVLAAARANPGAFLWHVGTNLAHFPRQLASLVLGHYDLVTPRSHFFALLEAALAGLLALGFLYRVRGRIAFERARLASTDMACLACLAAPVLISVLLVAPRIHYVMGFEVLLVVALAFVLRFERGAPATPLRRLAVPCLALLVAVPSLGSLYYFMNGPPSALAVTPRPILETVEYLRSLKGPGPLVVCESFTGAIDAYLGPGARSISIVGKRGLPVSDLIAKEGIDVFVVDDAFRSRQVLDSVPGLAQLIADPARLGFRRHRLEDSNDVILVSDKFTPASAPGAEGG